MMMAEERSDELARAAKHSRAAASELVARYMRTAEGMARRFSSECADDLTQEGLMALLDAVRSYDPEVGKGFSGYAAVCMRNRMLSFLKREGSGIQWAELGEDELEEIIADSAPSPEMIVAEQDELERLYRTIEGALSEREWTVLQMFLEGRSYREIGEGAGVDVKSVNNALQRVRRKLKALL